MKIQVLSLKSMCELRNTFDYYRKRIEALFPDAAGDVYKLGFDLDISPILTEGNLGLLFDKIAKRINNNTSNCSNLVFFQMQANAGVFVLFVGEDVEIERQIEEWWSRKARQFALNEAEKRLYK